MTEFLKTWWGRNSGLIVAMAIGSITGAGFAGIVWGVTLANRVSTIEDRGSPKVDKMENRLTKCEVQQGAMIDTLKSIADELRKHEIDTRK